MINAHTFPAYAILLLSQISHEKILLSAPSEHAQLTANLVVSIPYFPPRPTILRIFTRPQEKSERDFGAPLPGYRIRKGK